MFDSIDVKMYKVYLNALSVGYFECQKYKLYYAGIKVDC